MSLGGSSGLVESNDTAPFWETSVSIFPPGLANRLLFLGGGGGGIFLGLASEVPLVFSLGPSFRRLGIFEMPFSVSRLAIGVDVLTFLVILDDSTVSVDFTMDEILGMLVGLNRVAIETAELFPVGEAGVDVVTSWAVAHE